MPRGALKEELPRKADHIIKKEDDPTRYTVTRIVRKYGGKIEFVTDNDRRFEKYQPLTIFLRLAMSWWRNGASLSPFS